MSDLKTQLETYRAALAADQRMSSSSIAALMTETVERIAELEAVLMTESEKRDLLSKEHYRDRIAKLEADLDWVWASSHQEKQGVTLDDIRSYLRAALQGDSDE